MRIKVHAFNLEYVRPDYSGFCHSLFIHTTAASYYHPCRYERHFEVRENKFPVQITLYLYYYRTIIITSGLDQKNFSKWQRVFIFGSNRMRHYRTASKRGRW